MGGKVNEIVKVVDRLADAVLAIATRVDYLDGDMAQVIHDLSVIKESLGMITERDGSAEE